MSYPKNQLSLPLTDPLFQKHSVELIKLIKDHPTESRDDVNNLVDKVQNILFRYRDSLQNDVGTQLLDKEVVFDGLYKVKEIIDRDDHNARYEFEFANGDVICNSPTTTLTNVKLHIAKLFANIRHYRFDLKQAIYNDLLKEIDSYKLSVYQLHHDIDTLKKIIKTVEYEARILMLKTLMQKAETKFGDHYFTEWFENHIK